MNAFCSKLRWWHFLCMGAVGTLCLRGIVPIDETRYLSVAWEMWSQGSWVLPILNGEPYSHKPPLLFWLVGVMWLLTGVKAWSARMVPMVIMGGATWLAKILGRELFPDDKRIAEATPWLLLSMLVWLVYGYAFMFDMLLTLGVLMAWIGMLRERKGSPGVGMIAVGTAIGGFAKGPVVLVFVIPALVGVAYQRDMRLWGRLMVAVVTGVVPVFLWAIYASFIGGKRYGMELFWGQTASRIAGTASTHSRPFYWYLPLLPIVLYPWFFYGRAWMSIWRAIKKCWLGDWIFRFLLGTTLTVFVVFSLVGGKQVHYLLPLLPLYALLVLPYVVSEGHDTGWLSFIFVAWLPALVGLILISPVSKPVYLDSVAWGVIFLFLAGWGVWVGKRNMSSMAVLKLAGAVSMLFFLGLTGFFWCKLGKAYDLRPTALYLRRLQKDKVPIAYLGNYQGEFTFLGRLKKTIVSLEPDKLREWCEEHTDGVVIKKADSIEKSAVFFQPYRERWLLVLPAGTFLSRDP